MRKGPVSVDEGRTVDVVADEVTLEGSLVIPEGASGIVLFAHGSGSSRWSPRNRHVAKVLQDSGLATLLFDLLTQSEEAIDRDTGQLRFDVGLLARRLIEATDWIAHRPEARHLQVGYFGASTGATAALIAAANRPSAVYAVVSRGGRPDLAVEALSRVRAPTLLIVGSNDPLVLSLNQEALKALRAIKRLEVIPGATHLFEEPGTLERAARSARDWFTRYLS